MTILSSTESARRADEGKDEVIFIASPYLKYLAGGLKVAVFLSLFFIASATQAANPLDVVINEIAWMGTVNLANDEWIELYNNAESPISLDGWQLVAQDGTPKINLSGTIPANGFYLLERTDDTTVPNILADQIYTGALGNSGENLKLYDSSNNVIDGVDCSAGWLAGLGKPEYKTMERINSLVGSSDSSNWQTSQNPGGTPKTKNSIVVQTEPQPQTKFDEPAVGDSHQQVYPSGIIINEILPSPKGQDEKEEKETEVLKEKIGENIPKEEVKEKIKPEQGLAAIGKQVPEDKINFFPIFSVAFTIAIFSGVIILTLKKQMKKLYNKTI